MQLRIAFAALLMLAAAPGPAVIFEDDFERGLDRWRVIGRNAVTIKSSGDPVHGSVMELRPNGDVAALLKNSDEWGRVRLEGEMLFPSEIDNYLGFLYHFTERRGRHDFGLIYLKGNENYLQVNPHRDFNVSRLVYPEGRADLTGDARVGVNTWHKFALEVDGVHAHVYIGDMRTPQLTFSEFEGSSGAIGLQPRSVGGAVWVDNIRVRRIDRLSYGGPPIPQHRYDPGSLIVKWESAGPFTRTDDRLAFEPSRARWQPFAADSRGAVITGRIVDFHGPNTVAYFRSSIEAADAGGAELHFSTADDLAVWVNGEFASFVARQDAAWFDFAVNKAHAPRRMLADLRKGRNDVVARVRGGVYASGGFFARVVRR